jgi:hypothetical protein
MPDENLRGRYRRDFTREPIGGQSAIPPQPARQQPAQPQLAQDQPDLNLPPALAGIKAAGATKRRPVKKRRSPFKKLILFCLAMALLAALAAGGFRYMKATKPNAQTVPEKVKQQISVPILYPGKLPAGYKVIQSSFNATNAGVVAYYAEDNAGHRLNFTVQARPTNFDFEAFYSRILTNATKFSTPLGEAAVGTANDHLLGSLATTKSWVIVSGNSKAVGADKIQTALSGMQKID